MSKMTREEAHTILFNAINSLWDYETEEGTGEAMECLDMRTTALSILAPEPRTEPPTVDEVGDEEMCLNYEVLGGQWNTYEGRIVRKFWQNGDDAWLPYSALPMPKWGSSE